MDNPQRRHDISDEAWALIEPHLPGQRGQRGGIAKDNRLFINAVFLDFTHWSTMARFAA